MTNMRKNSYTYSCLLCIILLFLQLSLNVSLSPHPPPPPPQRCNLNDKQVLLELKDYFGANATIFSTWSPETDCCTKWNRVRCKKIPQTQTYHVNLLQIIGPDDVMGTITIPSTLHKLPYLETLYLRLLPNLNGIIPPVIGRLPRLKHLLLDSNSLSGPIPNFLRRLTNLASLGLNNNRLTGSIPASLGRLPHLQRLELQENQLIGKIPKTFGLFMNGSLIWLYNNRLSGPIPRSLGKVNFGILDFSGNQLTGDASFLFGEDKTDLAHLILSRNRFSFDFLNVLPVGDLTYSLLVLDLSHNNIYGRLPDWLGQAPMYQFDVSYNCLCGPIPTVGGTKGNLQQRFGAASFEHNKCLCGAPLPPCKS